ncbi:MAG: class I SAM-dependent rRNA methyltransferase [Burkholderiales bacterium]|nr:class I SAM-dependent rRNA methyltransferase [Burkholderiales bacterium]
MKKMMLKSGREKSLLRRHPWIFSGAVQSVDDGTTSGDVIRVQTVDGGFLAYAAFSAKSQIIARVLSFDERDTVDEAFYRQRIRTAIARRAHLNVETDAMRLFHAESDGVPGLIADRYGDVIVLQLLTAGIDPHRALLAKLFMEESGANTIFERSDADVRELEGLHARNGLIAGQPLPVETVITENAMKIAVDIAHGHKTGFYLDQRDSRALTKSLAHNADVLNCFCYTGTMSVAALTGGARSVLSIDSSAPSLQMAAHNLQINNQDASRVEWLDADVFLALRKLRDQAKSFDLIILDPPKFAPTAQHAEKAARAYKDINLLGLKLLRPGGHLMTFSCSGGISAELFQKIVAGAALDAHVDAQIVQRLGPGADHPVALHFPEGDYLKGLLLRR